jgi:3-hydroxyisobutyrate dehydrogenase
MKLRWWPAAGAGQAAKVCNNMVLAVQQMAIGEAFVLAEKLGLSAQSLFDVITRATGPFQPWIA